MRKTLERLKKITEGCRDDMHEPDEQGVYAVVRGKHLDNAMGDNPEDNCGELTIILHRTFPFRTERFNLATLIALARKADLTSKSKPEELEVYYTRGEDGHRLMLDTSSIRLDNIDETHVKMPAFDFKKIDEKSKSKHNFESVGFKVRLINTKPDSPDDIFALLNGAGDFENPFSCKIAQKFIRENHTHTSMSVGDIVKMNGKFYVCEDCGWRVLL